MKSIILSFVLVYSFASNLFSQSTKINFDVFFKDQNIGNVIALNVSKAGTTIKDIKTTTDTKILVASIHVESELNVVYKNGVLDKGIAYRTASRGNEDIHGSTIKSKDKSYTITSNGKSSTLENSEIKFCIADLYFSEPKSYKQVYSNMYCKFLDIYPLGNSRYQIKLPDGKKATYAYLNGQIQSIEVEMSMGTIITKRKV